jgi:hypothetical protein
MGHVGAAELEAVVWNARRHQHDVVLGSSQGHTQGLVTLVLALPGAACAVAQKPQMDAKCMLNGLNLKWHRVQVFYPTQVTSVCHIDSNPDVDVFSGPRRIRER